MRRGVCGGFPAFEAWPVLDESFWRAYTDRQPATDAATHLRALCQPWLPTISTVLEVGCNRGDNLPAFRDREVTGAEPNDYARHLAKEQGWFVVDAPANNLPFPNESFDLVFTVGVLIHIPPEQLDQSLHEIHRVSKRYVLSVEYDSPKVESLDYRGVRAGIWKRPYRLEYQRRFPDLIPVGVGMTGAAFDGCQWVMFEKHPLAVAA